MCVTGEFAYPSTKYEGSNTVSNISKEAYVVWFYVKIIIFSVHLLDGKT